MPDANRKDDMILGIRPSGLAPWAAWLILVLFAAPLAADPARGILWEIHDDAGSAGFLLGTVHSDRADIVNLPGPVREAFRDSRRFAFELDFDTLDERSLNRIMHLQDGRTLPDILPAGLWPRARDAARQRGIPASSARALEPWALAVALSLPRTNPAQVLDHRLQRAARDGGHQVVGLETAAEQLSIFDDLDRRQQTGMLRQAVDLLESGESDRLYEELLDAWKARDLDRIAGLAALHPALPDRRANDQLMDRLLRQRNERMVERMQPLLDAGNAFIAVGALHLVGDDGLLRLLEQRGFTLRPVY